MKGRSRALGAVLAGLCLFSVTACGEGAKFMQETDGGGTVVYPIKTDAGILSSTFRKEALDLIETKCRGRYKIVQEGETKGIDRIQQAGGAQEVVTQRRWAIRFVCR